MNEPTSREKSGQRCLPTSDGYRTERLSLQEGGCGGRVKSVGFSSLLSQAWIPDISVPLGAKLGGTTCHSHAEGIT